MFWRKWFVRGLVFVIVGVCAGAAVLYYQFTNPGAVRAQVLAKLGVMFPGAQVTVDSARLRLLGGISVSGIHLARKFDPDKTEFLHIPSAVLYHDKEKILDGELSFRKVELHRPRLRVIRNRDGTWNLAGLTSPMPATQPMATLVIHQGVIVVEDQGGSSPAFEFTEVNLTLINDPMNVVALDGFARADFVGKVHLQGHWQRDTKTLEVSVRAKGAPLLEALVDRLAPKCPPDLVTGVQVEGHAEIKADFVYTPGDAEPLRYDVQLDVKGAKVRHPKLPLPLDELDAVVRASTGELRVESLRARAGATQIEGRGFGQLPCPDQAFEARLEIKHLDLTKELIDRLPEKLRAFESIYQPRGSASFKLDLAWRDGAWSALANGAASRIVLIPEGAAVTHERFPYRLHDVTGVIDYELATKTTRVEVTGQAGTRPVIVRGVWQGAGYQADGQIDILATDIPLDETLITALPPAFQPLARSFNAKGKGDVKAHIRHVPGESDCRNEFHVRFHDCTIRWDGFPCPLREVSGFLDIYPKHWEFREGTGRQLGQGSQLGGQVKVNARSAEGNLAGLILELQGQRILLDDELRQALRPIPPLVTAWELFRPQGRLDFAAVIDRSSDRQEDLDVRVEVRGMTIVPTFFPYVFREAAGQFRFAKNRLELAKLSATHDKAQFRIERGTVDMQPPGGFYADLTGLEAQDLFVDVDFIEALPPSMRTAATSLRMTAPVAIKTRLVVAQAPQPGAVPDIFWDGQLSLRDAGITTGVEWSKVDGTLAMVGRFHKALKGLQGNLALEKATLFKQEFHDVTAKILVRDTAPETMHINVRAPIFGGDISGQARLEMRDDMPYEMNLTASQINLADFGQYNLGPDSELSGIAVGRLHLTGQGSGIDTLDGNGSLDVPNGKILNLPFLLDLLKFLGLRLPDRTAFEELHALFAIRGRRVALHRLEFLGNAISLAGKGEVNLDGTDLKIDFYPTWARLEQMLPPSVRPISPVISKNLLTIETRGKVTANPKDLKFTKKPLPLITDPLLIMRDRMLRDRTIGGPALEPRRQPMANPAGGAAKALAN